MDRFDRIYRLHGLLSHRRTPISLKQIMEQLECSKSTADRSIETLRDYLNAPLEYNREANGYFYNQETSDKPYELPGLWFSAEELNGLLICQQILQNISPGILSKQIEGLQQRINEMLSRDNSPQAVIADKIQFSTVGRRLKNDDYFKRIATALFSLRQMLIRYAARGNSGEQSERIISPQKLIFYRDNWYLAAYCHLRNALRVFSVDCIDSVRVMEQDIERIDNETLDDFLQSSYGIFTGKAEYSAVLQFSKDRANWVEDEHWHSSQQGKWLDNGHYQLSIPFSDSRELIMDILKHGAHVKVISPPFLQDEVKKQIEAMRRNYVDE